MFAWPQCPPQLSKIPARASDAEGLELDDNHIIRTIPITQSNLVVMLTAARVLVYNMKPFALISSHERSVASIQEFGENVALRPSIQFDTPIDGLFSQEEKDALVWFQGKLVFYVQTSQNYLLTYQILKNSTAFNTFTDYGISTIDPNNFKGKVDQDYDYNLDDDDALVVYEKGKSSKVIQDGYPASREKGLLRQILNTNPENVIELPIKKVELRLKIVLKFDSEIVDVLGFKKFTKVGDGTIEEHLMILFPNGLQLLSLVDFKLRKSSLIKVDNGKQIATCDGKIIVLGEYPDTHIPIVNVIDINDLSVKSIAMTQQKELVTSFDMGGSLALIFADKVVYFNLDIKQIEHEFKLPTNVKICKRLNKELHLMISENNTLHILSRYGNVIFASEYDEDDKRSFPIFKYTDVIYFDSTLLTVCETGEYQLWPLYELNNGSFSNFRVCQTHIINNNNNDILLYSPSNDRLNNSEMFPTIKLMTKTYNNCISKICVNENQKLMAVHIANKDILLIYNMETNAWYRYEDNLIVDMQWLGTSYLVCRIRTDNDTDVVVCARIPLQGASGKSFNDFIIWQYSIPEDMEIFHVFVNTLSKFRLLKIKYKDESKAVREDEVFYKTGEIIIMTNSGFSIFDVVSNVVAGGINIVKNVHEAGKVHMVDQEFLRNADWVSSYKDGYLIFSRDKVFKMKKHDSEQTWKTEVLLAGVERIVDVIKEEIYFIQRTDLVCYNLEDLWEGRAPLVCIPIEDELYPMSITPDSASFRSLKCLFRKDSAKLVVKYEIYLDKLIQSHLANPGADLDEITRRYYSLRHYKFALEKVLSLKIIAGDDLEQIVALVQACHDPTNPLGAASHADMLEIVSNCLRKIETKYWGQLFAQLKMTPRDLLAMCIECNETRVLGILLLVFLNYDEGESDGALMHDLAEDATLSTSAPSSFTKSNSNSTIPSLLKDQEMMLHILKILVGSAAATSDRQKAADNWDMCFQLIRILKALDRENGTQLVTSAIDML